jgi:hypothetical protein
LISCLSAFGCLPGANLSLGNSLVLTNPAPTFARDVPVGHTGNSPYKYIRFQALATKEGESGRKLRSAENANHTLSYGKFIHLCSSGSRTLLAFGWVYNRDNFALIFSIDAEIILIDGNDRMSRIQLTHSNQAKIGQIGLAIGVTSSQFLELQDVLGTVEAYSYSGVISRCP